MAVRREGYDQNVFINCPFDAEYAPLFEAIVFVRPNSSARTCSHGINAGVRLIVQGLEEHPCEFSPLPVRG